MPKKIDPAVKARCVRQVLEYLPEYPSLTAAAEAVARREGPCAAGPSKPRSTAVTVRPDSCHLTGFAVRVDICAGQRPADGLIDTPRAALRSGFMVFVRKAAGRSGATKVQIAEWQGPGSS